MKCEVDVQSGSLAGRHRGMTSVGVPWGGGSVWGEITGRLTWERPQELGLVCETHLVAFLLVAKRPETGLVPCVFVVLA